MCLSERQVEEEDAVYLPPHVDIYEFMHLTIWMTHIISAQNAAADKIWRQIGIPNLNVVNVMIEENLKEKPRYLKALACTN